MYLYSAQQIFKGRGIPFRLSYNQTTFFEPFHTHDFIEVVFVRKGYALHTVRGRDGTGDISYGLIPGDAFIIMPGEVHQYDSNAEFQMYNILFAQSFIESDLAALARLKSWHSLFRVDPALPHRKVHLTRTEAESVDAILRKIIYEQSMKKPCFDLYIRNLLQEVLIRIARCDTVSSLAVNTGDNRLLLETIRLMEKTPERDFQIEELARHAAMSVSSFSRKFRNATGFTPMNYLQVLRLENVRQELMETDWPISELAGRNGFYDCPHLIRAFRSRYQITPARFRKLFHQSEEVPPAVP